MQDVKITATKPILLYSFIFLFMSRPITKPTSTPAIIMAIEIYAATKKSWSSMKKATNEAAQLKIAAPTNNLGTGNPVNASKIAIA
ncbi:hypothetical protein D3C81_2064750 [compost metagenome]